MKIYTSDRVIAWLTLFSGLTISAVAVYYSVAGLVSIFAAAAIPIIVMGVALEVSKLIATVWLKLNWQRAPKLIKIYLSIAVAVLMLITSMGIFGYLSKAHLDQSVPTGDVVDKVALIDEKIRTQRENIDAARKALKQMDESVDQIMARSSDEKGADKAAALRRGQQKERNQLQSDIAKAQKEISVLNDERAPVAKELRKVEAEVGPIKYIAALIYGDNPDANILEKAVTWVIIVIVSVFDPLAVILLLASQYSFQWFRREDELKEEVNTIDEPVIVNDPEPTEEPKTRDVWPTASDLWPFPKAQKKPDPVVEYHVVEDADTEEQPEVVQWNELIAEAEKAVEQEKEQEDNEILEQAHDSEKANMQAWKHDNPQSSLKLQRRLLAAGKIDRLPWEDYLKPEADFITDNEAAEEALKWAQEQIQDVERPGDYLPESESKKKDNLVDGDNRRSSNQEDQRDLGYVQNSEQSSVTLWQRIKRSKE